MSKNDLYYDMCEKYTRYAQWGRKALKDEYLKALNKYTEAGGTKKVKII